MHCKNCGNQINPNAVACLSCGCDPKKGNKYCNNCGVEINSEQVICIKCGSSIKINNSSSDDGKMVAIISYLTLIGFIIALVQHGSNKTKLGAYHLRQVLGLMITSLGLGIIYIIAISLFDYSWLNVILILMIICWLSLGVSAIVSFINALNGKEKPAPIFGGFYEELFLNIFR